MTLDWTIEHEIGRLTLAAPPSNTMTMAFFREMKVLMSGISKLRGLKAMIITGYGRHFSSGADISELLQSADNDVMLENYHALLMLEQLEIPVISAIRGVCIGSAFELALFSHFRICANDAVMGLPESTFNLMPGLGGIQRVALLAGKAKAIEVVLCGSTFSAADGLEMNLVDAIVPKSQVLPLAMNLANALPRHYSRSDRKIHLNQFLKPLYANG